MRFVFGSFYYVPFLSKLVSFHIKPSTKNWRIVFQHLKKEIYNQWWWETLNPTLMPWFYVYQSHLNHHMHLFILKICVALFTLSSFGILLYVLLDLLFSWREKLNFKTWIIVKLYRKITAKGFLWLCFFVKYII